MSIKNRVLEEGMKLVQHPTLAPLLQDERVMKLLMSALAVPGKLEELSEEQKHNVGRFLGLAREQEVADLRRAVRSLEDELARLRSEIEALRRG
jgi:hypothetical protein